MSRIAGAFGDKAMSMGASLLGDMLGRMKGNPSWNERVESPAQGRLGWCGPNAANCAAAGPVIVVMDGVIYNRDEFTPSPNDAECFSKLYERYGFEKALQRLNGDFAICLYDERDASIWLGRDRFGLKPLYYFFDGDLFAFASRPAGLFGIPGAPRSPDPRFVALFACSHYRHFDNDPEASAYIGIRQLPAGRYLRVRGGKPEIKQYWDLVEMPDLDLPEAELASQYRELLVDAVRLRLKAASEPAFTLSGGMDSSSVLACAVESSGARKEAFSSVYVDKTYDESAEIRAMLDTKVSRWHQVLTDALDIVDIVREMIALHDEPVATATWLSHFLLCKQVDKEGFKSLFGGLGGDELNAGEYEYFFFLFADLRSSGQEELLQHEIRCWTRHHDHPLFPKTRAVAEDALQTLVDLSNPGICFPDRPRMQRYLSALNPEYYDLSHYKPKMKHPFTSFMKNRAYQNIYQECLPCCLRADDRNTTVLGLASYLPFLDHRLVEFMFRIPGTMKIRSGITKHLLREAMKGILPEETRVRIKKMGWNAPAHVWFSGRGRDALLDIINSRSFRERGIYRIDEVRRLIQEHEEIVSSGRETENHMMFMWQLINLELWLQTVG